MIPLGDDARREDLTSGLDSMLAPRRGAHQILATIMRRRRRRWWRLLLLLIVPLLSRIGTSITRYRVSLRYTGCARTLAWYIEADAFPIFVRL